MAQIDVNGRKYDVPESYTYRELGLIKRLSGVRAGEISEALKAGDAEVVAALAIIAMRRAGEDVAEDDVLDMDVSAITFDDDGDDEDPTPAEGPDPEA